MSGFRRLGGDSGDTRLATLLHEHWLKVASGDASWRTPNFFHPVADTLGYSDTFVLDLVLYAPLRVVGFPPLIALQITSILLGLLGFVGMYLVCRRWVGAGLPVALTCAWLVAFANNLFLHHGHQQLFAVNWVPWCILLAAEALTATTARRAAWWAVGCGALLGTLLYSTYYIGWFTVLTGLLVAGAVGLQRRDPFPMPSQKRGRLAVAFLSGLVVPLVPFALTYLPKLDETGGRDLRGIIGTLPDHRDLLNHGDGNIWHDVMVLLAGEPAPSHGPEHAMVLTPLLLLTVIACGALLWRFTRGDRSPRAVLARALVAVSLVLTVLPIRFGSQSLWRGIWTVVPGARALRAVDRIQLLNDVVAALAIACTAEVLRRRALAHGGVRRRALARVLLGTLAVLLVGEQLNTGPQARLDVDGEMAWVEGVPPPPPGCDAFIIAPVPERKGYEQAIDAMWIAQQTGLPTLNGYSGEFPPLWRVDPREPRYLALTVRWAAQQGVSHVCMYDSVNRLWDPDPLAGIESA